MIKILSGDNYRVRIRKKSLIDDFLSKNDILALEDIDVGTNTLEIGDLLDLLNTTSLFNPRKLVVLNNLSSVNDLQNKIELILTKVAEDISLIIVETKLDKKTNFGKYLKNHPDYEEHQPYKGVELENWLVQRADECQSKLSRQLAVYLIQRASAEALSLDSEIQKLCVYPVITKELIDNLVAPTYSSQIFDLLDALMKGKLDQAVSLYEDQRQQKNEPLNILGIFVWQLRILLIAKKSNVSFSEALSEFGLNQFAFKKARALVQNRSLRHIDEMIQLCYQADRRIRLEFINPDEALLFFIFKSCQLIN